MNKIKIIVMAFLVTWEVREYIIHPCNQDKVCYGPIDKEMSKIFDKYSKAVNFVVDSKASGKPFIELSNFKIKQIKGDKDALRKN